MTKNDNVAAKPTGQVHVPLTELTLTAPLRPVNTAHVALLAQVLDRCGPILVHHDTGRVIDGHHRAAAAATRGDQSIAVQWVHGDEAEILEVALQANTAHGLPLTREERRRGVDRLIELRPAWSNRRIADAAGVSDATVRRRRQTLTSTDAPRPPSPTTHLDGRRTGRDGKSYPVHRVAVADMLRSNPGASDRQIARQAGCSPTTVAAWRRRGSLEGNHRSTSGPGRLRGLVWGAHRFLAWIFTQVRRARQPEA